RMVLRRRGTPIRASTAIVETASVAETIAPSTNATAQGKAAAACATTATPQVVNATSPQASDVIGRRLARNSRQGVETASQYKKGGRKRKKTRWGSSLISGSPGTKPSTSPPTTSRTGYGTASRSASGTSTATAASKSRTRTTSCTAGHSMATTWP